MSAYDKLPAILDKAILAIFRDPGPQPGVFERVLARISPERFATMTRWTLLKAAGFAAAAGMLLAILPALWRPLPTHAAAKLKTVAISQPVDAHADLSQPLIVRADAPQPVTAHPDAPSSVSAHADFPKRPMLRAVEPRLSRRAARQARRLARVRNRSIAQRAAVAQKVDVSLPRATSRRGRIRLARFAAHNRTTRQRNPVEVQRTADAPLSISTVSLAAIEVPSESK